MKSACLIANEAVKETGVEVISQTATWYKKETVTFSEIMAYLKLLILNKKYFSQSDKNQTDEKIDTENLFE